MYIKEKINSSLLNLEINLSLPSQNSLLMMVKFFINVNEMECLVEFFSVKADVSLFGLIHPPMQDVIVSLSNECIGLYGVAG